MGIEFLVGRTDHLVTEDYLSIPEGEVDAIVLSASYVKSQRTLVEAARVNGLEVLVDPVTERLTEEGFSTEALEYADDYPIDAAKLSSLKQQAEFVDRVIAAENEFATTLVPPYFYSESEAMVDFNVTLTGLAYQLGRKVGKAVRPILDVSRVLLKNEKVCTRWAKEYRATGVEAIELRLSPLGDENSGHRKVSSALQIAEAFRAADLRVVLGMQPVIGQAGIALNLVDGYSTGIGIREQYDHSAMMSRQRNQAKAGGKASFGAQAGVLLPIAGLTIRRNIAQELYSDHTLRSRLACQLDCCTGAIDGPVRDPRRHYLHARGAMLKEILDAPAGWRANIERERLREALEIRELLNRNYLDESHWVKTRTVRSLVFEIDYRIGGAQTA